MKKILRTDHYNVRIRKFRIIFSFVQHLFIHEALVVPGTLWLIFPARQLHFNIEDLTVYFRINIIPHAFAACRSVKDHLRRVLFYSGQL